MANQLALTEEDIEKYTGVSGTTAAQFFKVAYPIANMLRGVAQYSGAAWALGGAVMTLAWVGAVANAFISIGLPVAQAKEIVRQRSLKHGVAIGAAIGLFGWSRPVFLDFVDRTQNAGFAPSYMHGVGAKAYNTGLCLGYAAAAQLSADEKEKIIATLTAAMAEDANAGGYKLYMGSWKTREWIRRYAAALLNQSA